MPASSTIDPSLPPLAPSFPPHPSTTTTDPPKVTALISHLHLQPHPEGGHFVETDRDTLLVPNPFARRASPPSNAPPSGTRSASTSIHYLLTPSSPLGAFHRNRARTVHTLHKGRGRYVVVHADEVAAAEWPGGYGGEGEEGEEGEEGKRWTGKARVETFVVGQDVARGEVLQWVVEGGKYKSSFLLPDREGGGEEGESEEGLLISETVVPGFEYADHDFMGTERLEALVEREQAEELKWMVRKAE